MDKVSEVENKYAHMEINEYITKRRVWGDLLAPTREYFTVKQREHHKKVKNYQFTVATTWKDGVDGDARLLFNKLSKTNAESIMSQLNIIFQEAKSDAQKESYGKVMYDCCCKQHQNCELYAHFLVVTKDKFLKKYIIGKCKETFEKMLI